MSTDLLLLCSIVGAASESSSAVVWVAVILATATLTTFAALAVSGVRWLRIAQREHYLPGTVGTFARRWWFDDPRNTALFAVAVLASVFAMMFPPALVVVAAIVVLAPLGLSLQGRTGALAWTRRLRTVALVAAALAILITLFGLLILPIGIAIVLQGLLLLGAPLVIDAALRITIPWEKRQAQVFVDQARERLAKVDPRIVGITGSYGKTSTKNYLAHLLQPEVQAFATPASFNNRAGLCRAINENLVLGNDVFIAEMGTYGKGEIAELCSFCPPSLAVLTAIGPVHLERFRTEEAILEAKAEIFETADTAVLNIENPAIAAYAETLKTQGKRVVTVGESGDHDVVVDPESGEVRYQGAAIGTANLDEAAPTNLGCAIAAAIALGVEPKRLAKKLQNLPSVAHRQTVTTLPSGVTVIDDTFNSNPAGAAKALELLAATGTEESQRMLVTPGIIELGPRQFEVNREFAEKATKVADVVIVVGRTNRKALLLGCMGAKAQVVTRSTREDAVSWVREHAIPGDVVLYENDLPDHYA